ncbi:MAG TPA: FAD-dependent oxidoreductase [Pyrinomonadaceae bacterium]|nr:FAD-dependent oxidoreductase [Pyrinomonadaceae bacterium]
MNRTSQNKPIVIIGGGIAGLTAANYLHRRGHNVRLFEAGKQLAGLAQSFHDPDGFTYDFGAHFITNRLAAAIGVGAQCRDVPRYGETVTLGGKNYGYPFGLMRIPRFTASGVATKLKSFTGTEKPASAAEWFRSSYGKALADEVAIPLTEAWSGARAEDLASSVGDSIPGSIAHTLFLKLAGKFTGRAVACGYSREMPEKPSVWHVYPNGGVGVLCEKLAENLNGAIRLESPVQAIYVENNQVAGVRAGGQDFDAAAVVSTAPAHVLPKLVQGTDALDYLARFRYRPMVFVNMRFRGRGLLPDVVTWTPESSFPFFRLTETPLSMPWLAPEGKTLITVDIGCEKADEIWQMEDEALGEMCLENLLPLVPDARERYLGSRVLKTPLAYPVFLSEYEADRQKFEHGTGVENLYSVGRNGEFRHIFMEDAYWRTLRKMQELEQNLSHGGNKIESFSAPPKVQNSVNNWS